MMCRMGRGVAARMPSIQPWAVLQGMAIGAAAGGLEGACRPRVRAGQRVGAGAGAGGAAVGDAGVGPEDGGDVVLVALGGGEQGEPGHEVGAGERTHAAEYTEDTMRSMGGVIDGRAGWPGKRGGMELAPSRSARSAVQGHRGARGLFPGEHAGGVPRRTIALGVRWIELDVGVLKDGTVVVHHDLALNPDLARLPGRAVACRRGRCRC